MTISLNIYSPVISMHACIINLLLGIYIYMYDVRYVQVINHGIERDVINKMMDVSKRFFELPLEEREKLMSSDMFTPVRYGTSFNQNKDGVFCWRDFLKLSCHLLSPNLLSLWPSSPVDFRYATKFIIKSIYPLIN